MFARDREKAEALAIVEQLKLNIDTGCGTGIGLYEKLPSGLGSYYPDEYYR